MESEERVQKVLENLTNLKDARPNLQKISVTEDNAPMEREEIKELVRKANEENREDGDTFINVV